MQTMQQANEFQEPVTIKEYASWIQLICTESILVSKELEGLIPRAEKIVQARAKIIQRVEEEKLKSEELDEQLNEMKEKPPSECLAEMKHFLEQLKAENQELQKKLAETPQPVEIVQAPDDESDEESTKEDMICEIHTFFKSILLQSVNAGNVWNVLPVLLKNGSLKDVAEKVAASNLPKWEEVLKISS